MAGAYSAPGSSAGCRCCVVGQPDVSASGTLWSDAGSLVPDVQLVSEQEWLRCLRVV